MSRRREASDDEEEYHSNEEGEFSDSEAGSLKDEDIASGKASAVPVKAEESELAEATQRLHVAPVLDQEQLSVGPRPAQEDQENGEAAEESEDITPSDEEHDSAYEDQDAESAGSIGDPATGSEGSVDIRALDEELEDGETKEIEKKEPEPFDVPAGGSFWLHDDRMMDDGNSQQRRPTKPKKLWAEEDESPWKHDRFNIPPEEDDYMGFLQRKRSGRGGRGGCGGAPGFEQEIGYGQPAYNGWEGSDGGNQGQYGNAFRGRGRGRASRGRGTSNGYAEEAASYTEPPGYRGRGSRGGRGGRARGMGGYDDPFGGVAEGRGRNEGSYDEGPESNANNQSYSGNGWPQGARSNGFDSQLGGRGRRGGRNNGRGRGGNVYSESGTRPDANSSGGGWDAPSSVPTAETGGWDADPSTSTPTPAAASGSGWDSIAVDDNVHVSPIRRGWDAPVAANQGNVQRHAAPPRPASHNNRASASAAVPGSHKTAGTATGGGWDAIAGEEGVHVTDTSGGWDDVVVEEQWPVAGSRSVSTGGQGENMGGRYGHGRGRGNEGRGSYTGGMGQDVSNAQPQSSVLNSTAQEWPSLPPAARKPAHLAAQAPQAQQVAQNGREQQAPLGQEAARSSSGTLNASAQDYRPELSKKTAERLQNLKAPRPKASPMQPQGEQFFPQQPYLPTGVQPYVPLYRQQQQDVPALGIPAIQPMPYAPGAQYITSGQAGPYMSSGFIPPPMQQPQAYAPSMPVKRPIAIEAPPERQGNALQQQQQQQGQSGGGRRYSAMSAANAVS